MAKKKIFSIGNSLSDGLEQTFAAAQNYSNELRIDVIPLNKIELDPDNPRSMSLSKDDLSIGIAEDDILYEVKIKEKEELQSLATSIQEHGILNPVLVYQSNAIYRLVAGERRTLASILAGKFDIQAKIIDQKPNELKIRLLQWVENFERSDLSLFERLQNFEMIISAYAKDSNCRVGDVKSADISRLIGCSKTHASNLKLLIAADLEIKQLIAANKISNIEKIAVLCQINDLPIRKKAIQEAINGATLAYLKQYLEVDDQISKDSFYIAPKSFVRKKKINLGSINNIYVAKKIFFILLEHLDDDLLKTDLSQLDVDNPRDIAKGLRIMISSLEQLNEQ